MYSLLEYVCDQMKTVFFGEYITYIGNGVTYIGILAGYFFKILMNMQK